MKVSDLSVLYIYDDETYKSQILEVLKENVNTIAFTSNIDEAKSLYQRNSPCLIIVSSFFKDRSALNFLKELREVDLKTAFIIVSNNKKNDFLNELMELYVTKYIDNTFSDTVLINALNKCMEIISKRLYSNVYVGENLFFNFHTQSIIKDNQAFVLNKKQALLIDLFIQNPNKIISYEEIKFHIWQDDVSEGAFKSLFRDLRKNTYKGIVKNYSGLGYKLNI